MLMLSRTASSLYWLGRYVERADFIARLVEATVRLDVLSPRPAGEAAWGSALAVTETDEAFEASGADDTQQPCRALPDARHQPSRLDHPLPRHGAQQRPRRPHRADARSLDRDQPRLADVPEPLLARRRHRDAQPGRAVKAETRGFEGAIHRMLRNQATWFIRLGPGGRARRQHRAAARRQISSPAARGRSGRRRGRPRPVDDDPPDRLGGDRLSLAL